jgi:ubiquinone/menaquinone biosynthesis C-methylase UbiE
MLLRSLALTAFLITNGCDAFVVSRSSNNNNNINISTRTHLHAEPTTGTTATEKAPTLDEIAEKRRIAKAKLFGLVGTESSTSATSSSTTETETVTNKNNYSPIPLDPILADPITKEALQITKTGTILGGQKNTGSKVSLVSKDNVYSGRTNTFYNLLAVEEDTNTNEDTNVADNDDDDENNTNKLSSTLLNSLQVFIPPPIRPILSSSGVLPGYIPMRDLFTSPSVSFAYERGWRQGFASAGFPGADKEYELVKEYFAPLDPDTVVDMSCATGLFTRRLAKGNDYARVIGCDYSEAMLLEARNRITSDPDLNSNNAQTKLDLVRCDVGEIPMMSDSVPALHAGAAMHCWPDLESAMTEIHRVLKPGGRFFASTFLAPYFRTVQAAGGNGVEQQAFQYFESVEELKEIVMKGGFKEDEVDIEILGSACAIIRASKSSS